MEYKLKDDLTLGSLESIKTKTNEEKLTIKWKCEKKIRHQVTVKKGELVPVASCQTGKIIDFYKWNGKKFIKS